MPSEALDDDLIRHQDDVVTTFSRRWGGYHHCSTPGIGTDFPIKSIRAYSTQGGPRHQVVRVRDKDSSLQDWIPAANLDASLIVEYHAKKGTVIPEPVANLQHVSNFLSMHGINARAVPPQLSKLRLGSGSLAMEHDDPGTGVMLQCNTEKDRESVAVNATSAGG
ncbi:hypothetical protein PLESTM_001666700 [Pleodorina starrii]|nr:hypothetical protein PLESTM_001666700 [Pleodorina starrii]